MSIQGWEHLHDAQKHEAIDNAVASLPEHLRGDVAPSSEAAPDRRRSALSYAQIRAESFRASEAQKTEDANRRRLGDLLSNAQSDGLSRILQGR